MILDHCNCRNKNREETQLIDWNNQITECVWLLCLDGFIIIIIIIVIVSSSSAAPHHFLHSFHTATYVLEKPPLLMWKPQGSPKSHPIEIHYLSCLSVHTVQTPHSSKKFESRNLPNYFCTLCLRSLTPTITTTAITLIMIISNHKDNNNNNNNPIKVGWKEESCYFWKYFTKAILHKQVGAVWCGVVWNLPNQVKFNYVIIMCCLIKA